MREKLWVLAGVASCVALAVAAGVTGCGGPAPGDRVVATPAPTTAPAVVAKVDDFHDKVTPLLRQYCYECHGDGSAAADLALDAFATRDDVVQASKDRKSVV